ncbi:hypothetical protein NQ176_g8082 [Zarea fungicola]|uniref:Uncharacterized protein n=1 Tax=Zarea fungicola TaxID=93591 RepID=A0ACC1MWA9_9HYPO|nr:hypothetical protein NQ176_g8082 [Lecanicillium fungicola]
MKFLVLSTVFALAVASVTPEDVPITTVSSVSTATTLTSVLRPTPTGGAAVMNSTASTKFRFTGMSPDALAFLTGDKLPDGATILDSTPVGEVPEPLKPILNLLPSFLKKLFEFYVFKAEHGDADARGLVVGIIDAIQGVKRTTGNLFQQILGTVQDTKSEAASIFQQVHEAATGESSTLSVKNPN